MKLLKAFKFQLKTNDVQESQLRRFAGCCRLVWNKALHLQKIRLDEKQGLLTYNKMAKELLLWKYSPETFFLTESPAQALQQILRNLDRALRDAFNKKTPKRFPRFKKRGSFDSFRIPQGFKIDEENSRVFLPKIGWVNYRNSRNLQGIPKNITISKSGGHWFVSIQTEQIKEKPIHEADSIVGLDLGVAQFVTLSDGTVINPVNCYRKHEKRLKALQRQLSKKERYSNNWKKQKVKVQRLHSKIANVRRDYINKTSTIISKNHAIIVIEDLSVSAMSASAKGTIEKPGKNIKAKSGLNKSILDQGWYEFRRQLTYKQEWRGGMVILINPRNTSRTCVQCGHVDPENRRSQACFECVQCGHIDNADINAAKNILAAGHVVLACGEAIRPRETVAVSVKHEPPERASKAA